MEKKKLLIISIDRDNDLLEKAGVTGPVIGRDKNLESATKLALADPEDVDANAIFQAIKIYDEFVKRADYEVEICSLTGSRNLGFEADTNISQQLDHVLSQFHAKSAVIVTDGADDDFVLPIISSRIKIDSVKKVYMKQSKELEKTYVTIIEKLRDPYYAKLLIGIPAVLFAILGITLYLNWGIEAFAIMLSIFLFMRLFRIDERIYNLFSVFEFSVEKVTSILYFIGIIIIVLSFWIGQQSLYQSENPLIEKRIAESFRDGLNVVMIGGLIVLLSKMIDNWTEKNKMSIILYGLYTVYAILFWMILISVTDWILLDTTPPVSFGALFIIIIYSIVLGFIAVKILNNIRIDVLKKMKLDGKIVINTEGMYIGKVKAISKKEGKIIIETSLGKRFSVPYSKIKNLIEDKLFIKL